MCLFNTHCQESARALAWDEAGTMAETKPRGTLLLNPELMVAILKQYAASSTHGELEGILADFLRDDFGKQQVVGASRFMLQASSF